MTNMYNEISHMLDAVIVALLEHTKTRYMTSDLVVNCLQPRDRYKYGLFIQSINPNDQLACCFYFNTGPFDVVKHIQDEELIEVNSSHKVITMLGLSRYDGAQQDICDFLTDGPPVQNTNYILYEDGSRILFENNVDKILYEG